MVIAVDEPENREVQQMCYFHFQTRYKAQYLKNKGKGYTSIQPPHQAYISQTLNAILSNVSQNVMHILGSFEACCCPEWRMKMLGSVGLHFECENMCYNWISTDLKTHNHITLIVWMRLRCFSIFRKAKYDYKAGLPDRTIRFLSAGRLRSRYLDQSFTWAPLFNVIYLNRNCTLHARESYGNIITSSYRYRK